VVTDNQKRSLPAVETVLQQLRETGLPRPLLVATIRRELAGLRQAGAIPARDDIMAQISRAITDLLGSKIRPVINATGIIVHTNLGRAPLGESAGQALQSIAGQYNNLEFDLATGQRGRRGAYLEAGLAAMCRTESATIVNNGAAALVLILKEFTSRRNEVIVSRGELVQIGGGFRIPDILESSGATLREVGTTNQTDMSDYAKAIGEDTGLILKVHRSNFFMDGFVASPSRAELSKLARDHGIPLVEDLGSGAFADTSQMAGLEREPTPAEAIKGNVDLVCFSGDKLMGGPQAGIIAGNRESVDRLKRNPFFRALRCDRLVLAAMQAVVDDYLNIKGSEAPPVPVIDMMKVSCHDLKQRAEKIIEKISDLPLRLDLGEGNAQVGGGSLPRDTIPSVSIDLASDRHSASELAARLRHSEPPIIGYPSKKKLKLDLRTVFPAQDGLLISTLRSLFV
jgi:L-seryl-tRNA(Ser) seleniumtransferase